MKEHESSHSGCSAARWSRSTSAKVVLCVAAVCLWLSLSGQVPGYGRSSAGSAVRAPTRPPSSYQGGLVERPGPAANDGNLLITGNVAGGKYFHGGVPYRSTTSIDAPLGSTSLDSFMRYTQPIDLGGSSAGYNTFYSPTGTVTTLQPDRSGVFAPVAPGAGLPTGTYGSATTDLPYPTGSAAAQASAGSDSDTAPLSLSTGARLRSGLPSAGSLARTQAPEAVEAAPLPGSEEYRRQLEELQNRLGQVEAGADELERTLGSQQDELDEKANAYSPLQPEANLQSQVTEPPTDDALSRRQALLDETARLLSMRLDLPRAPETPDLEAQAQPVQPDRANGLRLYDPRRDSQLTLDTVLSGGSAGAQPTRDQLDPEKGTGQGLTLYTGAERADDYSPLRTANQTSTERVTALTERLRATSGSDNVATAVGQAGVETPPSVRQASPLPAVTNEPVRRERDASPPPASGRAGPPTEPASWTDALVARDFLVSASALARYIESDPKRAMQRTELIWTLGGPERFIASFNDLAQRAQASGAPELKFLLAYIYYQMERPEEAKVAIDAARRGLSSSAAVEILSTAVNP